MRDAEYYGIESKFSSKKAQKLNHSKLNFWTDDSKFQIWNDKLNILIWYLKPNFGLPWGGADIWLSFEPVPVKMRQPVNSAS